MGLCLLKAVRECRIHSVHWLDRVDQVLRARNISIVVFGRDDALNVPLLMQTFKLVYSAFVQRASGWDALASYGKSEECTVGRYGRLFQSIYIREGNG